ncbi:MAG: undecaprenyl-diphosphate phosphatase [Desulfovibrionales bacterium]|nr:MAG: undecaprenyl-diphosphate phosphatase [Desulfovibrionales bacterium]
MSVLQATVLALVQGLTEFLPISSSAHLILVSVFTPWEDQGLTFDVAVHLGTLMAVIWYFRQDLWEMVRDFLRSLTGKGHGPGSRLAWAVILGTIPVGLAGLTFRDVVADHMRDPLLIAGGLIVFGLLLGWADWRHSGGRSEKNLKWVDILVIGCAQALALIPGVSRSGVTITAGLFMGLSREASARFSFLLSIPVIFLADALELRHLLAQPEPVQWGIIIYATVLSGLTAYLCIHYFLKFIKTVGMQPFVAYRLLLGILLIWLFW